MSSPDSTKKRRIAVSNGGGDDNGIVDDGITMSKILAKLNDMENRCISMQSELDRCISSRDAMQEEFNTMQKRLSHMDELETRCSSLQRSVHILIKDQKWMYNVPTIPWSHWEHQGFDANYITGVKHFLNVIKNQTCQLRIGTIEKVRGSRCVHLGTFDDMLLRHDNILMPHWIEFTNALQLYYNIEKFELTFTNIQLTPSVKQLLSSSLKGKPISALNLENIRFVSARGGIDFATECIKSIQQLEQFEWINNNLIESTADASYLLNAVISHPSINNIRFTFGHSFGNNIDGYEVLCSILTSSKDFISIDFSGNRIQTRGGSEIPDYIAMNTSLTHLYLEENNLNDEDAMLIAQALKDNNSLKEIHLERNVGITDVGRNALLKTMYDPTSLNSLSDCNHTCYIYGINPPSGIPTNNNSVEWEHLRGGKIFHLLSSRNAEGSNVYHLNLEWSDDDSLVLVPQVLGCIFRHSFNSAQFGGNPARFKPISIIYEIIRGWKMPELFEKRS